MTRGTQAEPSQSALLSQVCCGLFWQKKPVLAETLRQNPLFWLRSPSVVGQGRFVEPGTQKLAAQPGPLHTAHTARRKMAESPSSQSPQSLPLGVVQAAPHWT
jgi:hypothetical protein